MKKLILILFSVCCLSFTVQSTPFHRGHWISGRVSDLSTGNPMPSVAIKAIGTYPVKHAESRQDYNLYLQTDSNGYFRIFVPRDWDGLVTPVADGINLPAAYFDPTLTSHDLSLVVATDGIALADDIDRETITISIVNGNGDPLENHTISLMSDPFENGTGVTVHGGNVGVTDVNGITTLEISCSIVKIATLKAIDTTDGRNITLDLRAVIDFVLNPNHTDHTLSTVIPADGSAIADGIDREIITVTILNANGDPIENHTGSLIVEPFGNSTGVIFNNGNSSTSDINGVMIFEVSCTEIKTVTFKVTDTTGIQNIILNQRAIVDFVAP